MVKNAVSVDCLSADFSTLILAQTVVISQMLPQTTAFLEPSPSAQCLALATLFTFVGQEIVSTPTSGVAL